MTQPADRRLLTEAAGNATYAATKTLASPQAPALNPLATVRRGAAPRVVSLLTGSNDEQARMALTNCTLSVDTVNTRYGNRAWKLTSNGAAGNQVMRATLTNLHPSGTGPLVVPPWQGVVLEVYIPDPSKFINLTVNIFGSADLSAAKKWAWNANTAPLTTLTAGRNFIRVPASFTDTLPTGTVHQVDVQAVFAAGAVGVAGTELTIMGLYLETPPKARFILVEDRGYKTFYQGIYPDMKARNWPVTVAVDCTMYGSQAGTESEAMSLAQMKTLAAENGNSISFHGWDGAPTATMTADQLRADTVKAIKHLQLEFPDSLGRFWRAAYVQNDAPQWAEMRPYLLAASAATTDNLGPTLWPPNDWHRIRRISLDNNKLDSNIDDWFTQAQATHLTYHIFVHGMGTSQYDVSPAKWARFRDQLDAAIAAGWAEVGTFEQFYLESGGTFRTSGGATVAEYTDAQGARVTKTLM